VKGKQGTGKNVWLNAVGNILGLQHYISSSNPKDFFGDYGDNNRCIAPIIGSTSKGYGGG
jgi:hypothetical protein